MTLGRMPIGLDAREKKPVPPKAWGSGGEAPAREPVSHVGARAEIVLGFWGFRVPNDVAPHFGNVGGVLS